MATYGEDRVEISLYTKAELLGKGSFGTVHRYEIKKNYQLVQAGEGNHGIKLPTEVAVKEVVFPKGNMPSEERVQKEVNNMKQLKHKHVVRLYCTINRECSGGILAKVAIVMEKCDGTLSDMITAQKCYDLKTVSYLFKQVVIALEFIHGESILHRDIKPANVLISTDTYNAEQGWLRADPTRFTLKLGDFGSSRVFESDLTGKTMSLKGTLNFMAPEIKEAIVKNKVETRYSSKADIFSAALTMLVLFTKQLHDVHEYTQAILEDITGQDSSSIFLEFIKPLLDKNPQARPNARDLLSHKFLSDDYKRNSESYHHSTGHLSGRLYYQGPTAATSGYETGTGMPGREKTTTMAPRQNDYRHVQGEILPDEEVQLNMPEDVKRCEHCNTALDTKTDSCPECNEKAPKRTTAPLGPTKVVLRPSALGEVVPMRKITQDGMENLSRLFAELTLSDKITYKRSFDG